MEINLQYQKLRELEHNRILILERFYDLSIQIMRMKDKSLEYTFDPLEIINKLEIIRNKVILEKTENDQKIFELRMQFNDN